MEMVVPLLELLLLLEMQMQFLLSLSPSLFQLDLHAQKKDAPCKLALQVDGMLVLLSKLLMELQILLVMELNVIQSLDSPSATFLNGEKISVDPGTSAAQTDATVRNTFSTTLYNPNVFTTPNATGCADAYKKYLCRNNLPWCGQKAACVKECLDATKLCSITDSHKLLYDCFAGKSDCSNHSSNAAIYIINFFFVAALALFL